MGTFPALDSEVETVDTTAAVCLAMNPEQVLQQVLQVVLQVPQVFRQVPKVFPQVPHSWCRIFSRLGSQNHRTKHK